MRDEPAGGDLRRYARRGFEDAFRNLLASLRRYSPASARQQVGTHAANAVGFEPKETCMTNARRSLRQLAEEKNACRREEMQRAVADGRLVIRRMTAHEREQGDARWAAAAKARDNRAKGRQHS
jgi:hypothetical protein